MVYWEKHKPNFKRPKNKLLFRDAATYNERIIKLYKEGKLEISSYEKYTADLLTKIINNENK